MAEAKRGGTLAERLAARAAAEAAPPPTHAPRARPSRRTESDDDRDLSDGPRDEPGQAPATVTVAAAPATPVADDEATVDAPTPGHAEPPTPQPLADRGPDEPTARARPPEPDLDAPPDLDEIPPVVEGEPADEDGAEGADGDTLIDLDGDAFAEADEATADDEIAAADGDGAGRAGLATVAEEPTTEAEQEPEPSADDHVEVPVTGGDRGFFAGRRARRKAVDEQRRPAPPDEADEAHEVAGPTEVTAPEVTPEAAPATDVSTGPPAIMTTLRALRRPVPRRGVGRRLLPEPTARLTEPEPRDVLFLTVAAARGIGLLSAAVLFALSLGDSDALPYAFAVALALTLFRIWQPGGGLTGQVVETTIMAGVLVVSDGMLGPFSIFAATTSLAIGADRGLGPGVLAGTILSSAGVAATTGALVGDVDTAIIVSWVLLYPLTGVLGTLTARSLGVEADGQAALREVNRVLRSLRTVAHEAPAALQTATVARAVAGELVDALEADAAVVLMTRDQALVEVGRSGEVAGVGHLLLPDDWQPLVPAKTGVVTPLDIPPRLRQVVGDHAWSGLALRSDDRLVGVVLLLGAAATRDREHRRTVTQSSRETAMALDNATIFSEIEQLAAGAERERIADDLHDGVAQQLTHVRFELELLGRRVQDDEVRDELGRLARVAGQATDDVRSSIRGLRATALDAGLATALQALVADLDSAGGPELILDVRAPLDLDVDMEGEVFRIIQEALSNALRHAAADHILIEVDDLDGVVAVVVEDDGEGLEATADDPSDGEGLGLPSMQARAERLGGTLSIGGNELGGVRIELRVPPPGMRDFDDGIG